MSRIALVTGFEPWAEHEINSSWEAVRLLADEPDVKVARLPVDHARAAEELDELLLRLKPHVALCCGMAAASPRLRLETVARKPAALPRRDGPDLLPSEWPVQSFASALDGALGLDSSEDAGGFVCETTMWALLDFRRQHGYPRRAAFLHVPAASDDCPSEAVARGVLAIVREGLGTG